MNNSAKKNDLPAAGLFKWEIGAALLIKVVLLIGLWFLLFRWSDRPKPEQLDMARHLALPAENHHSPPQ